MCSRHGKEAGGTALTRCSVSMSSIASCMNALKVGIHGATSVASNSNEYG